ncbi:MAG: hydrolase [Planctomycetota bacterium]
MPVDDELAELTIAWSNINSGTDHVDGVTAMAHATANAFGPLADNVDIRPLPTRPVIDAGGNIQRRPVGPAVVITKAGTGPRILLSAHLDTVFPKDSPFQTARRDGDRLLGPGVADIKGGIVVMLHALRAADVGLPWTVVLNPDEEVGSPSSTPSLHELAQQHDVGFVFEPAVDGKLAANRGGSGNFDLILRGRSAHVGRNFADGSSAIHLACEATNLLVGLNAADGVTVNIGKIDGGGPPNVVADLAVVRMNVRVADAEKQEGFENDLRRLTTVLGRREGITAELHGAFFSPPKPACEPLLDLVIDCGKSLGLDIGTRDTAGVCDGNKLAAAGLRNVDTMGVIGGGLHSHDEWCAVDSLRSRGELLANVLERIERDGLPW